MRESDVSYRLPLSERLPRPWRSLVALPWWQVATALVVALLLGSQILHPNGRVIKALAGVLLFVAAYRAEPFWSLCFIAIMFLFPFEITLGSSTMIFVLLTTMIYLARLTLNRVPPLKGTPVDAGIGLLAGVYVLSFYNISNAYVLHRALFNMFGIATSFTLFYLIANFVRTEQQLRTFVNVLGVSIALASFVGLFELFFPGRALIPHYILSGQLEVAKLIQKGYRVGGPLRDYELFGEFMAMNFFLALFISRQARTPNLRFFATLLAVICVFMMLTSVTRGAAVSFLVGVIYLLWSIRRKLKFRDLVSILLASTFFYLAMEFVVTNFTRSGSVMKRLLGTRFVGLIPDSRAGGWGPALQRALEHPFIGHGPFYDLGKSESLTGHGLYVWIWPHNQYLYYLHTVGFLGLAAFLFIALRLLFLSVRERAPHLSDGSYPRALMLTLSVMMVVFLVDQTKIDYLRNPIYQYYPWMIMGLIAATHRILRQQEARLPEPNS